MLHSADSAAARDNLCEYLAKATAGEIVVIERNDQEVARLIPAQQQDWRDKMRIKLRFLVSPEDLIEPVVHVKGEGG